MNLHKWILSLVAVLLLISVCAATYMAGNGLMEMIQRHMGG